MIDETADPYDAAAIDRARGLLDAVPERVGPYRLLERIGGGGMGEVYVAEQTSPIKRRVAVKLIKAGMDTRQVVARFEAERQALAMMDHPNIARVFDAGTAGTGRPYFVMELVRGVPITQFCDANKYSTRQRVELLVPVCLAVQHAHQKGIIHRDLKPTNVLVTLHDGRPVPKVIDFGIAKATGPSLTDKTVYTEFHAMIGTPAYMSPEQAEMSSLDIDTRSDIYSLGVLTYELLTGTTPFDTTRLVKAGLLEIQRIIKEEDPPRPSLRLSTMAEASRTTVAGHRDIEPARISKLIAGELDWIAMKALDKDRQRRYETASDMAADLGRHLQGEPVEAAPPNVLYQLRKFSRKHKTTLTIATIALGALGSGTVTTTWQWLAAREIKKNLDAQIDHTVEAIKATAVENCRDILFAKNGDPTAGKVSLQLDDAAGNRIGTVEVHRLGLPDDDQLPEVVLKSADGKLPTGTKAIELLGQFAIDLAKESRQQSKQLWNEKDAAETEAYIANLTLSQAAMQDDRWPEARQRLDACPASKRGWEWTFLRKRANTIRRSLELAGDCPAISPDGKLVFVRDDGSDAAGTLCDLASGRLINGVWDDLPDDAHPTSASVAGHSHTPAIFSLDSNWLAISAAKTVYLCDVSGRDVSVPLVHDHDIHSVRFSPNSRSIFTTTDDLTVRQWDLAGRLLNTVAPQPTTAESSDNAISQRSNDKVSIDFEDDGSLALSDVKDSRLLGIAVSPNREYRDYLFIPGTRCILAGSGALNSNGPISRREVIDLDHFDSPEELLSEKIDSETRIGRRESTATKPSQAQVIFEPTPSNDGAKILIKQNGIEVAAIPAGAGNIRSCDLSPDRNRLISLGDDNCVRFWDPRMGREIVAVPLKMPALRLRFTADGTAIVIELGDRTTQVWDIRDDAARQKDRDHYSADIPAARAYVHKLMASDAPWGRLTDTLRNDLSLTTSQLLVASHELDYELVWRANQSFWIYEDLRAKLISRSRVLALAEKESDPRLRSSLLQRVEADDWLVNMTRGLWPIVDRDDLSRDKYQLAADIADELLTLKPLEVTSDSRPSTIFVTAGAAYYHVGRYDEALRYCTQAIALNKGEMKDNDAFAYCRIAMTQHRLGQTASAKASLRLALAAAPETSNEFLPGLLATASKMIAPASTPPSTQP